MHCRGRQEQAFVTSRPPSEPRGRICAASSTSRSLTAQNMLGLRLSFASAGLLLPPAVHPPAVVHVGQQQRTLAPVTTEVLAFIQPDFVGAAKANKQNPTAGGNAEANWWTGSKALETDCDGNRVTKPNQLTQACIYEKKVAEVRARQAINELNGQYKVEKLERDQQKAADAAARRAADAAATKARQAKYANKR